MYEIEKVKIVKLISGEELVTIIEGETKINDKTMVVLSHPTQAVMSADEQLILVPFILAGKTSEVVFDEDHIMTIVDPQDAIAEAYINILKGEHKESSDIIVPDNKIIT